MEAVPYLFFMFFVVFPTLIGIIILLCAFERRSVQKGYPAGWPLLVLWVATNTIGFFVADFVVLPNLFHDLLVGPIQGVVASAVLGLEFGVLQWLALRYRIAKAFAWVLVTAAGFATSSIVGVSLGMGSEAGFVVGSWAGSPEAGVVVLRYGLIGATIGAVQYILLSRWTSHAAWWIAANAVGFGLGFTEQIVNPSFGYGALAVVKAFSSVAIVGVVSGTTLVLLLRRLFSWTTLVPGIVVVVLASYPLARAALGTSRISEPYLHFIGFSTTAQPADQAACRQAVAYALDRRFVERRVERWSLLVKRAAYSIEHPRSSSFFRQRTPYEFNRVKAAERFGECAWEKPLVIWTDPQSQPSPRSVSEYYKALEETLRQSIPTATISQTTSFDALIAEARSGRAAAYEMLWKTERTDFGYPSTALGIAESFFSSAPEIKTLLQARDARMVERKLLDEVLIIPVLHWY